MIRFLRQFGWLLRRKTKEEELREEMQFHLESEIEDRQGAGMAREQAKSETLREFGNVTRHQEDTRSTWGWRLFGEFRQDLQYGLRNLCKNPGFAAVAVGTLAIGMGATTAVFSIVNGILFEAFPYQDPQRLVLLFEQLPKAPA
jgi:putative ABC transport system permease protein